VNGQLWRYESCVLCYMIPSLLIIAIGLVSCSGLTGVREKIPGQELVPFLPGVAYAQRELGEAEGRSAVAEERNVFETVMRQAMATEFVFTIYARPGDSDTSEILRIAEEAFAVVEDLEARISNWRPDSQTSYVNNHAAEMPVRVSVDLFDLIKICKEFHRNTQGVFDITVGPLLRLWGFYRGEGKLPSNKEIEETLGVVGLDSVHLNPEERTVTFAKPGVLLDFGGIGKGLALDRAAEVLRQYGVTRAILHAGTSTVVVIGTPPGQSGWTVRIRNPYNENEHIDEVVLVSASLSTSGAYEKFFEIECKKYCHIFDPRTGRPVEGMLSASAIAPSGVESDALSTSFFVLGEEGTRSYCRAHPGVGAILVPIAEDGVPKPIRINLDSEREVQR